MQRTYVGEIKLLGPCTLSVEDISVTLYKNVTVTEHIGKLADLLSIFYRLVERYTEIVRAKYSKVCVVALKLFI